MNKVFLIGNLTKDPEMRSTQSGVAVCNFTIAVNRRFKNANGEQETDFLNVIAWRQLAELCGKYLAKGRKVAVTGSIQTRTYEAKDGSKRTDGVGYRRRRGGVPVAAESAEQHTERAGGIHDGGEQRQRGGLCAATAQRFWRIHAGGRRRIAVLMGGKEHAERIAR